MPQAIPSADEAMHEGKDTLDCIDSLLELDLDESGPLSPPLFDKAELRKAWAYKSEKDTEGLDAFLKQSPHKQLMTFEPHLHNLDALAAAFPNFAEVILFFKGQVAISIRSGKSLNIPPINLQGEPGIGKTVFVQALATALSLEFFDLNISAMQAEFELVGGNHMWSKANIGALAKTLVLNANTYHPIILLDEICLLSNNEKVNMYHPLYGILDKEQARRFRDNFLDTRIDVSNAIYVTTTNNLEKVPPAIRSRLINFCISKPSQPQMMAIIPSMFAEVLHELNLQNHISANLPRSCLERLADLSPREIKLRLKSAVGRALLRDSNSSTVSLTLSDVLLALAPMDNKDNGCAIFH